MHAAGSRAVLAGQPDPSSHVLVFSPSTAVLRPAAVGLAFNGCFVGAVTVPLLQRGLLFSAGWDAPFLPPRATGTARL